MTRRTILNEIIKSELAKKVLAELLTDVLEENMSFPLDEDEVKTVAGGINSTLLLLESHIEGLKDILENQTCKYCGSDQGCECHPGNLPAHLNPGGEIACDYPSNEEE